MSLKPTDGSGWRFAGPGKTGARHSTRISWADSIAFNRRICDNTGWTKTSERTNAIGDMTMPGRAPSRVATMTGVTMQRAIAGCVLTIAVSPSSWAAERPNDILGLRRLDATLNAESDMASEDPLVTEELFMLSATAVGPTETPADTSVLRAEMLAWLNEYSKNQVLFRRQDMIHLRRALATIPEDQLTHWASDSEALRERLFDETWPLTQQWLRDFLAVQAIYSADEIEQLRRRFATLSPSQLIRVLDHFQTIHLARLRSRAATEQFRMQQLSASDRMRPRQANRARQRSLPVKASPPTRSGVAASTPWSDARRCRSVSPASMLTAPSGAVVFGYFGPDADPSALQTPDR